MNESVISPIVTSDTEGVLVKKLGFRIFINPRLTPVKWIEIIRKGAYERHFVKLFQKECKKGMTVLDVGAQYGYYSFLAAKLVGPKGKVFSFEPDPKSYSLLLKGIKANNFKNIVPVCKAISNINGSMNITLPYMNPTREVSFSVKTVSLDDFFKYIDIDIIKMDIDGAETFALKGMREILKRDLKIFLELHPDFIRDFGGSPVVCVNALLQNDFKIYSLDSIPKFVELDPDNIDENIGHYFCSKQEKT